jgi:zinc transport system substrate-binding protein
MTAYQRTKWGIVAVWLLFAGCAEVQSPRPPAQAPLAVSSPYLEAALTDLLDTETPLVRLAGPGMCPGHFDIRPDQVSELHRCRLFARFDFQQSLDRMLDEEDRPTTVVVSASGGLCLPETYLAVCRMLAQSLEAEGMLSKEDAQQRMAGIEKRLADLSTSAQLRVEQAGLRGAAVLCSAHQADFCRWLGLQVAAEMPTADEPTAAAIADCVKTSQAAGVKLVVANRPEGRRAADALAERLGAKVVVFDNFPQPRKEKAFDAMVEQNLDSLINSTAMDGK